MGVAFTGYVLALAFYIVLHFHVKRCTCGPWTGYEVLLGITGHRSLRIITLVRSQLLRTAVKVGVLLGIDTMQRKGKQQSQDSSSKNSKLLIHIINSYISYSLA